MATICKESFAVKWSITKKLNDNNFWLPMILNYWHEKDHIICSICFYRRNIIRANQNIYRSMVWNKISVHIYSRAFTKIGHFTTGLWECFLYIPGRFGGILYLLPSMERKPNRHCTEEYWKNNSHHIADFWKCNNNLVDHPSKKRIIYKNLPGNQGQRIKYKLDCWHQIQKSIRI